MKLCRTPKQLCASLSRSTAARRGNRLRDRERQEGGREQSFTGFSGADWRDRLAGCQWWHCNSVHFIVVLQKMLVVMKVCNTGALF